MLREMFHYNDETGQLSRLVSVRGRNGTVGSIIGSVNSHGYLQTTISCKVYKIHTLVWLYVYDKLPVEQIDHIDHDRTNNRISNLRAVSHRDNMMNRSQGKNNTSGYTGVSWSKQKNKWYASIKVNKKSISLGFYVELDDAIEARKQGEAEYNFHENHGHSLKSSQHRL